MSNSLNRINFRFELNPTRYPLTEAELDQIKEKAKNPHREQTYLLIGLFVPALVNIIGEVTTEVFTVGWLFIINSIIAILTIILGSFFIKGWLSGRKQLDNYLNEIKNKPKFQLKFTDFTTQYTATAPTSIQTDSK